jgi:hypothetical protein
MPHYDWLPFLKQWSTEILSSKSNKRKRFPLDVIDSGWLGYPGATDDQIASAEQRLGRSLPPSYAEAS